MRMLILLGERELTAAQLLLGLGMTHRPTLRNNYLHPAMEAGLIDMTISNKPKSRMQKYRLTEKGKKILQQVRALRTP